ncbi:MAG: hypothetical protein JJ869_08800 [Marivita sp.]|uniref:hypothetical protein n=1 Tax=Marivita sp. TaxID=2003365 RepID=UPI001B130D4D|nr:hypothetical protein [Marivita sp.]MBO6883664.1 hypothetical protein [Marivita sp.]
MLRIIVWPVVATISVLVFKDQIRPLLLNIRKFGPSGVEIHAPTQNASGFDEIIEPELVLPPDIESDPVAREIYASVISAFEGFSDQEKLSRLYFSLTYRVLEKDFYRVYLGIFGSQIRVLELLNASPVTRDKLEADFLQFRDAQPPLSAWSLDQYLKYLFDWRLISEETELFKITSTGNMFLVFLASQQLDKNKSL